MTGVGRSTYEIGKNIFLTKKEMSGKMFKLAPKCIQTFKNIDDYSGEAFNIGVNALGTAAVAPVFIAYNPLSKTDENTKKYSAMRQPISAILAILTQCSLVIPWDRFVDHLTNKGLLGQYYSQEGFQDAKYLFRQAKKANPTKSKDELNAIVKNQQADQYAKLYSELLDKHSMTIGSQKLTNDEIRELIIETCDDKIKKNSSLLDRYKTGGEKYTNKLQRAEYLYENREVVTSKLGKIKEGLSGLTSQKDVDRFMKETIKEARENGSVSEWIKILEEDLRPKGDKDSIIKQINHIQGKVTNYGTYDSFGSLKGKIIEGIQQAEAEIQAQKAHFEKLKEMAGKKASIAELADLLKKDDIEIMGKASEIDKAGIAVIDKYISKISKRIKGTKAVSGLVLSLAIMPFTCCALNYLYPRFMDTFFPSLAKAKKGNAHPENKLRRAA